MLYMIDLSVFGFLVHSALKVICYFNLQGFLTAGVTCSAAREKNKLMTIENNFTYTNVFLTVKIKGKKNLSNIQELQLSQVMSKKSRFHQLQPDNL